VNEKLNSNLKAELTATQTTLEATRQDLHTERAALVAASLDFAVKLACHEEAKRLLEEEVLVSVTRRVARLEDQQARETEREGVEEKQRQVELLEKEVNMLREEKALEEKTKEKRGLRARYDAGALMDEEKDFVEWLLNLSSELHEQEDVVKDNELRRRENMNAKMQGKIRELESALARMLKEKQKDAGVPSKSTIDLNAWMTSSPIGPEPESLASVVAPGPADVVMAAAISMTAPTFPEMKSTHASSPSALPSFPQPRASAPVPEAIPVRANSKKVQPPLQPPASTFRALDSFSSLDEDDSEDDIPLSEMSATFHASASASVLGKRERAMSPAKIIAKMQPKKTGNANGRRLVARFAVPGSFFWLFENFTDVFFFWC